MDESKKTIGFVATAAVLGLAALGNAWFNQPGNSADAEEIGKPFYEDFTSTEAARSLEVSAIDPETGSLKRFGVKSDGDLWRIPTHFDYPAEAAARIAETSASVMGIDRQAVVGRGESEFEKFGVVDPLAEDVEDPETAGKRITLSDENGDPLVDYIIGNEVEDSVPTRDPNAFDIEEQKDFYVRRADETKTYRVSLDVDLSTRFSDWIDPDLLRINRPDVTDISINNYKIEEKGAGAFGMTQLFKAQGDQLELFRPTPADPWSLTGINENEELETDRINEVLGVLDELKIVGVRPKFKFEGKQLLTPELTPADIPEFKTDPEKANMAYQALQEDLMDKGFNFGGTQEQLELVSENGELEFGTSKGLRYRLHVGKAVSGDDEAIEIGSKQEDKSGEATEAASGEDSTEDDSNRFMYVRVTFDEKLIGPPPTEPKLPDPPAKPEGYEPAKQPTEDSKEEGEKEEGEKEAGEAEEKSETEGEAKPGAEEPVEDERDPAFVAYEEALEAYETAKGDHEMNLTRYGQDVEAHNKQIEDGKKLVDELNQRFGDWYYVISASNLNTLQSARVDLIKAKEAEAGGDLPTPPAPDISFPNIPGGESTFENGTGEAAKPADEMKEPAAEPTDDVKAEAEGKADADQPANASPEKEMPADGEPAEAEAVEKPVQAEASEKPAEAEAPEKPAETEKPKGDQPADKPATEETPVTEEKPATEEKPGGSGADKDGQQ